jgi:DNA mismatch endonuclease (patch repair protein)
MKATRQRDTLGEMALRSALTGLKLRYRVDVRVPGIKDRADVAFIKAKISVFVDGCFWHGCPEHRSWPKVNSDWWREKIEANIRRDADTTSALESNGWVVLRFWAHEDMAVAAKIAVAAIRNRSE